MVVFWNAPRMKSFWRIPVMEDHGDASNRIQGWELSVPEPLTQVRISGLLIKSFKTNPDDFTRVCLYWDRGGMPHRRVRL